MSTVRLGYDTAGDDERVHVDFDDGAIVLGVDVDRAGMSVHLGIAEACAVTRALVAAISAATYTKSWSAAVRHCPARVFGANT
ncbi:hypothetical protein [Nocardia sp. NPDC020380]|uniref:hypothetical protein n=1 Tax=Nocardia sp. NPDC020380 TaxID=3364309 RepID=UPI0037BD35F5